MKYLRQFLLILLISFIGELLHEVLPLPVPASVYGFAILFIGLLSGVIKLAHVKDTGKLLIEIMPVMFIPAGVGLLESYWCAGCRNYAYFNRSCYGHFRKDYTVCNS